MRSKTSTAIADAAAWQRAIAFEEDPSPAAARALLKLQFSQADLQRMRELAAKARAGALTSEEERLINTYEQIGCVLDIIHSKSRRVLKHRRTA
jgi:hypothetical protein